MVLYCKHYTNYSRLYMQWTFIIENIAKYIMMVNLQKNHMTTPLLKKEFVSKAQPLREPNNAFFCGNSRWQPPWTKAMIFIFHFIYFFLHSCSPCINVCIEFVKYFDRLLGDIFQTLWPMERITALVTHHWQTLVTFTIHIFDHNPIGLCFVCHETWKNCEHACWTPPYTIVGSDWFTLHLLQTLAHIMWGGNPTPAHSWGLGGLVQKGFKKYVSGVHCNKL